MSFREYKVVRNWMYRNARPLDLARWQYHFEGGEKDNVLSILEAYQNDDGGFGHALEPDSWNHESSPIQTWVACEIIQEVDCPKDYPMITKILSYLENCKDFNGTHWLAQVPSNNEYPHAPWWGFTDKDKAVWGYNPTAALIGFILCYGEKESSIYNKAKKLAQKAIDEYGASEDGVINMHELSCYIRLLNCIMKLHISDDMEGFDYWKAKIMDDVKVIIEEDLEKWESSYCVKPSRFIDSSKNIFYKENAEYIEKELDFIISSRNKEGVWNISWNWGVYEKEFSISENWWKAEWVLKNMRLLKAFKRIG